LDKKVGIIGLGSMGKMLLDGFVGTKVLSQNQLLVSTHTKEKLQKIKLEFPDIVIFEKNSDIASKCDVLFICVNPSQVKGLLEEIAKAINPNVHLISIAGRVTIKNIESKFIGKISRLIPSITSIVCEGISLVCHNHNVKNEDRAFFEKIIGSISSIEIIDEKGFETAAELTSCVPGLIAAIFEEFVGESLHHNDFSREVAERMVVETLYGTAKLIRDKRMGFLETVSRVATKGGITEEGAKALKEKLPEVFKTVFDKMFEKSELVKSKIRTMY
jgi:pyrroline-5-carboxylate reductase